MATEMELWVRSPEYLAALAQWKQLPKVRLATLKGYGIGGFEQSSEFRNARLRFRKRINGGYSKASH